jgi:hypothetical protein
MDHLPILGMEICAEATFARRLDRGIAGFGIQLAHDAVDMVLNGELGEIQVRGNFFVGHAPGEKRKELLLPGGKAEFRASALVQYQGPVQRFSRHELKEVKAKPWRTNGFALRDPAHSGKRVGGTRVSQQIAADAGTDGLQEDFGVVFHSQEDNSHSGRKGERIGDKSGGKDRCAGVIGDQDVAFGFDQLVANRSGVAIDADHVEIQLLAYYNCQSFAEQAIFDEQE